MGAAGYVARGDILYIIVLVAFILEFCSNRRTTTYAVQMGSKRQTQLTELLLHLCL